MKKNLEKSKTEDNFEEVFKSTQKTAKSKRLTNKDVEQQIKEYRKQKNN